jgi:hypothetical protein
MAIPQSQLDTWSNQGAMITSSQAYTSIRTALESSSSPLSSRRLEIFLQGSYANTTNIYADSDIDVVVLYQDAFHKDMTALPPLQQALHEQTFPLATYTWNHLYADVLSTLRSYFGNAAVKPGTKAIKVQTSYGRMTADVVPALEFRKYAYFSDGNNLSAHWGVQFFDSAGNPVINYPKYHIARGEAKNHVTRTSGQYKSTIRVFKNFRNYMVGKGFLAEVITPSYFVEGLLYNVPDNLFIGQLSNTVPAILTHLWQTPYSGFLCQNGVVPLIGNGVTQWPEDKFLAFRAAAVNTWNNY